MAQQPDLFDPQKPAPQHLADYIFGIIADGAEAGGGAPNPYQRGTYEHSLFEDGRRGRVQL